jgi:NADPH-dependent 2,4-dienoyl-CoA reductase/sulfur reductase-like enzyme
MHVVIIGNGISGVTAARFIRKQSDHKITIISSETKYFFSRTALMYIYMGHMRSEDTMPYEPWFWEKNRIELKEAHVDKIDFKNKALTLNDNSLFPYDKLILALGSASNKFGWPGQDLDRVGGLYHMQDLENMEKYSEGLKRAVIVGGGLIGIEMAEMFHSRHIPVTMLVREKGYWDNVLPAEESAMVTRHIRESHIDLRLETELKEIINDGTGAAKGVITNKDEEIACGYVGLTAGVHPNVRWLKETDLNIERGIVVNNHLETNVKDVYAIGDCAQLAEPRPGRRNVEAIWYTGRMMGETVAYNICGKPVAYDPGIWFNSAKFIHIEYQVYGAVLANPPENHESFYWEHSDGRKAVRIVFDKNTDEILGFNLMGIRFRHEVCEKWLRDKTPVDEVMADLKLANFDPEFYTSYEADIVGAFNNKYQRSIKLASKGLLDQVYSFLKS